MSSYKLRRELFDDPLTIGYAGMTDAQALASITDVGTRNKPNRDTLTSADIYNVIVRSEYQALSPAEKAELGIILGLGDSIDVSATSKARAALAGMFAAGSDTRPALLALITGLRQSRAVELGIKQSVLSESGVAACRMPDQPDGDPV